MADMQLITIEVEAGWSEEINVTPLGGNRFRIEEHMILSDMLGICDEIEGEFGSERCLRQVRIVHKAGSWR